MKSSLVVEQFLLLSGVSLDTVRLVTFIVGNPVVLSPAYSPLKERPDSRLQGKDTSLENPTQFFDIVDISKCYLERPRKFILLCGGALDRERPTPLSAREQFLRAIQGRIKFDAHDVLLAEDVDNVFHPDSPYKNLIEFEVEIAQISDIVVLFSEGSGSLAELGAFSQVELVARRIMVIIQLEHFNQKSFIRDGPIRYLKDNYPESVEVFDWSVRSLPGGVELDLGTFAPHMDDIIAAIRQRLLQISRTSIFNNEDVGQKTILIASIADVFGAAKHSDFKAALKQLGINISDTEIRRAIFCAKTVNWLQEEQRGHHTFYFPNFTIQPCKYAFKQGVAENLKDVARWKIDIRAYWQKQDALRSRLIADNPREDAPK